MENQVDVKIHAYIDDIIIKIETYYVFPYTRICYVHYVKISKTGQEPRYLDSIFFNNNYIGYLTLNRHC